MPIRRSVVMVTLMSGACNVPHLARQARIEAAAGRLDQAIADYDAALTHERWLPKHGLARLEKARAEALDARLLQEIEAVGQAYTERRWLDGFAIAAAVRNEATTRGTNPVLAEEADRLLEAGVRAYLPLLRARVVPTSFEDVFDEIVKIEACLADKDPLRGDLDALRRSAAAWHAQAAAEAKNWPGAAYFHEAAAVRYVGGGAVPSAASRALQPHVDIDWQLQLAGPSCPELSRELPKVLGRSKGAAINVRVEVARCEARTVEWTAKEPQTIYVQESVPVVVPTTTTRNHTMSGASCQRYGDVLHCSEYSHTNTAPETTYTMGYETRQVPRTVWVDVPRLAQVFDFQGRALLEGDGTRVAQPFTGSARAEASGAGMPAEHQINRALEDAVRQVAVAIQGARGPILRRRAEDALAAAAQAEATGDIQAAAHGHVIASHLLRRPPPASEAWFRARFGLEPSEVMAILDGRLPKPPAAPTLTWPAPNMAPLARDQEIAVPWALTDRRGHTLLAAEHVEVAWSWRQTPLRTGAWASAVRLAGTGALPDGSKRATAFHLEVETPRLGGDAQGYSAGLMQYGGLLDRRAVFGVGAGLTRERLDDARYTNLGLPLALYLPATRWVTVDLGVEPNLLFAMRLVTPPRAERYDYTPVSLGVAANLGRRLYLRGQARHYLGADQPVSWGLTAGMRL